MKKNLLIAAFFAIIVCNVIAQPNFNQIGEITGSARIYSTKIDKKGNIYYSGFYSNGSDFNLGAGTYTVAAQGYSDPFIAKYDASYNLIWVKTMAGSSGYDYGYDICVDDSGYVYGVGVTAGTSDLDPGPAVLTHSIGATGMDMYIIKLDSSGTMKWVEAYSSVECYYSYFAWKIKLDNDGNLVTSTYFPAGTVDFSFGVGLPQPYTFSFGKYCMFKQTKYKQFIWLKENIFPLDFTFDENNNIYTVGDKMTISKLNSAGTTLWNYMLGGNSIFPNYTNYNTADVGSAICYDKRGNIYITGSTSNAAIDYNPGSGVKTLSHNNSSREIYVLKWDTTANFKWVVKFDAVNGCGTQYYNYAEDIKTDNRGNVYTCGGINVCDFDPSATATYNLGQACNGSDLFISKLDSSGNYLWAKSIGSVNGTDYLKSIAITPAENVIFGGFFSYRIDIDPGPGITYIGTNTSLQNALVGGVGCNTFSEKKDSTCSLPYVLNGYNYTQSGKYVQSIAASGVGCDSLIYLDLKATGPNISVSSNTAICEGGTTSLTVNSTSSGVSYEWNTGANTTNISVSPSVTAIYTATVTSIADSNCKSTKTISVTVNNLPIVTLGALSSPICVNTNSVTLNGLPSGGTYTGNGVSGNSFNPTTAGIGTHTLMYVYTDGNSCSNNDSAIVQVDNFPIVTLGALSSPMCINASSVTLNGSPSGGTYTGTGVIGNSFNPAAAGAGTHTLMYVYTDGNSCSNNDFAIVQVDNLPIVTLGALSSPMCINASSVTLNGSPSGGTYTGTGVIGNSFNPATAGAGTHTLMYVYTDGNGCGNSDTTIIQVDLCTEIMDYTNENSKLSIYPNPTNGILNIDMSPSLLQAQGNAVNMITKIQIINMLGKKIIFKPEFVNQNSLHVDVSALAPGIYFLKVDNNIRKFVKE